MKIDRAIVEGHLYHSHKHITINGDTETVVSNLFVVTGIVRVFTLYGYVETATLDAAITACWWDLFPTAGASVPLTKEAGAPAMSDFEVGSLIIKDDIAANMATVKRANAGIFLEESSNYKKPFKPFIVGKKNGAVTQIRFMYTAGGAYGASTGKIDFIVVWEPVSDDGELTPA